jgi:5-methylcytosine-specific restriction endonuclease McrA
MIIDTNKPKFRKKRKKKKRINHKQFYKSMEWRKVRYQALLQNGNRCQCCGRGPKEGVVLHVDHIKPRKKYPELKFDINNLQILCEDCNIGKMAHDETDWREGLDINPWNLTVVK